MEASPFPCVSVRLPSTDVEAYVAAFLEQRESPRWVLLGDHAVQGEAQLWTAWVQAVRHELRGSMVARSEMLNTSATLQVHITFQKPSAEQDCSLVKKMLG